MIAAVADAALMDGHRRLAVLQGDDLLAAVADAALMDGHQEARARAAAEAAAAVADAALMDGHVERPGGPLSLWAAVADAALMDGHKLQRHSVYVLIGRGGRRGPDGWTLALVYQHGILGEPRWPTRP